ncbi:MAG: DUF4173 domain-containing protein [Candidatus Andersenbacteria bacterium]|nr:DUF4173 domain-containing protein [Candidatus Andersenbacteria bacterium]MBI3250860.1 DUF4173 domain-containing protein [Candidatus Andersenbacteria bacterium]
MDQKFLKALHLILISLGLAIGFNYLFFDKLIGISVLLFVGALVGTVCLFGLRQQVSFQKSWWLVALIAFFALMPAVRANPLLTLLNVCATFGLLMLLAQQLVGTPSFLLKFMDYFTLVALVPFRMLGKALSVVSLVGQARSQVKHRDMWLRIVKGALMAVPALAIFGLLFSQADLAFSQFVNGFIDIQISERTIQYTVLLAVAFVAALCFLSYIFFTAAAQPTVRTQLKTKKDGRETEVLVFLGLISALFLLFIGFQITYLFGGEANIINAGFTYAEYARRGFWELLAVAVLSLLVLLASEKYSGSESTRDSQFLIPSLTLIGEVAVIIVSAFKRLSLYIDAYGMTILRFYVAGFIMLLLVLFVLLAVKFIRRKQEEFFAFGALLSVAAFLIAVNLVNPDAFISRSNMQQYNRTGKVDVSYIRELSADALPSKIELYTQVEGEDKEVLRGLLQAEKDTLERNSAHWQSANISRVRGLRLLQNVEW